jgi:hypothetical protein
VIMKNRKTRISGEVTRARDRPDVPARGHLVPARREHADACGERDPEPHGDREQSQAREDREPAGDDDREREHHPRRQRRPPEVERLGETGREEQEAQDEPDVRGVEDVASADADDVLREQGDRRHSCEDPPPAQAPPVAVLRSGDAQDERDAVAGQQGARRPHDHALPAERDRDLEHRAGAERDEDLGDGEVEAERRLSQHLERDDHCSQMQPRVARRRQQDWV